MVKLGPNGLIYYASVTGDNYVIQITSDRQEAKFSATNVSPAYNPDLEINDRPYIQILEEHQSLAPVMDVQLRESGIKNL